MTSPGTSLPELVQLEDMETITQKSGALPRYERKVVLMEEPDRRTPQAAFYGFGPIDGG